MHIPNLNKTIFPLTSNSHPSILEISMEQNQQPSQSQQSAESYYSAKRKRSFLYSRITVLTSMTVLIVALGINVSALISQERSTTESKAAAPENSIQSLPSLPKGCVYQQAKRGFAVTCPTPTPSAMTASAAAIPVDVSLPKLPPQCTLQTTTTGSKIQCITPHTPIPTVAVTLPASCLTTTQANIIACKDTTNKTVTSSLPSLPTGCVYKIVANAAFVVCDVQ
jgi:hypothetical protein